MLPDVAVVVVIAVVAGNVAVVTRTWSKLLSEMCFWINVVAVVVVVCIAVVVHKAFAASTICISYWLTNGKSKQTFKFFINNKYLKFF